MGSTAINLVGTEKIQVSFASSQLVLFQSRMKWGIVYALATVAGLFLVPGTIGSIVAGNSAAMTIQRIVPLPVIALLITTGMFLLNDLLDIELDRANGKKRPLPSGQVTKKQAWIFIAWTNILAVVLSLTTGNLASIILVVPMLAIGILYSAPKVALDDKFLIKTVVIAIYYMLCAALGATAMHGLDLLFSKPSVFLHAAFMLGVMRFISSTLNDTGDVDGDQAAGRRTIPIVIGRENTIKMSIIIMTGMVGISWVMYALNSLGIITVAFASVFTALLTIKLSKTIKRAKDKDFIRKQHKKLLPFDLILLFGLSIGVLLM